MISRYITALTLTLSLLLASCGGADTFRINGEVEGLGTRSLKFYYYDGERLKTGMATALDGKFQYEGTARRPVLISISTNQGVPIGHLMVENGDAVNVKFFADRPLLMEVKGNDVSGKYASFLKDNYDLIMAGPSDSLDAAVEKFVTSNHNNMSAVMALQLHYNLREKGARADSLLNAIDQESRPSQLTAGYMAMLRRMAGDTIMAIEPLRLFTTGDSLTTVDPGDHSFTLFVFYDDRSYFTDDVKEQIAGFMTRDDSSTQVLNVSLSSDTAEWKQPMKENPVKGLELWIPGSVSSPALERFNLNVVPTVVMVDSTGTVLYTGPSVENAIAKTE
ncbi:MAG: DUF4369 domain-containing protein [Muribaculaceae bacterium]|nr:DUF4369 domain-containing protein [Muribaculaceae bacterium]